MSKKGAIQYAKFKKGEPLTRKGAILAQCYECNGYDDQDCHGNNCPLYGWSPFNKNAIFERKVRLKLHPKLIPKGFQRRKKTDLAST
jgi:hypothetical protein